LHVLFRFLQNRLLNIFFDIQNWPNNFLSGKPYQKRPKYDDLAFKKPKWQWFYDRLQQACQTGGPFACFVRPE
jgi:hypothetical protein